MTELDDDFVPFVAEMAEEFGAVATFDVTTGGTYSPSTGAVTGGTTTQYQVKIIPPEPYSLFYVDGDVVREGDLKTMIQAQGLAFTPARNMKVTFDSRVFTCLAVDPIYSGALVCGWMLQLRGGA
jgi:hypothetical protein